ncbi:MAG TPA: pitrilysin family protein [Allosphingosinicella sp.]|nr:pitrilysin family protein [Allosphingosinicella sp.]
MRKTISAFALAVGLSIAAPASSQTAPAPAAQIEQLLRRVNIPFETFTLDNGLRVVVHEDRKAPVVAVSVWYNVGSKDEPAGRTGFAHLFEHIMFNGSENARSDFDALMREIGATDFNGTTSYDRTNYFQTVPRGALERTLFLESDRMGHLLGALTQENLTNQIGVVQNEKRQGDNQPYGLVKYVQREGLFPEGHPYRHTSIGSMADLSASTLETVRDWFRDNYGPNNAVLVLAGDLSAAEARPLVERYFGHIPRGAVNSPAAADVPTLPARVEREIHDRVANTRLYRWWTIPGLTADDHASLQVAAQVFGGLASSRLDNALVRGEQTAVRVVANVQPAQRVSIFEILIDVKPGQDPAAVGRRLDELFAEFLRTGPTEDEVRRAVMRTLFARVQGLEQVGGFGGKAVALAEGTLYADDANFYRTRLAEFARITPDQVRAAMQRWLGRPVFALTVSPGEREPYAEAPAVATSPGAGANAAAVEVRPRAPMPGVVASPPLDFPSVGRARLSNGIEIVHAQRAAVPVTRIAVEFNAGVAADPADRLGTQAMMLTLLREGTTSLNSIQLAEAQERIGAAIATGASLDRTVVSLTALTPSLDPSLDLLADVIRNPAFAPAEVERIRAQQLAGIAAELTQPAGLAARALPAALYGPSHPYGRPSSGTGDPAVVRTLTRDELIAFHQSWIRPDNATIFVVSDMPLSQIRPLLERRFGNWRAPARARGVKRIPASIPPPRQRIVLIDRPQSPQSFILAGQVLNAEGTRDLLDLTAANEALGGGFTSRINMDLRERRGWSYGAGSGVSLVEHQVPYVIQAPVQSDRTGDSIAAARELVRTFLTTNGVTAEEMNRLQLGNSRQLPGQFETSPAVLGALRSNALYRRPDNYWETIAGRYRGMTAQQLDAAARRHIRPDNFIWVVVGDAARVRPQLEALNLPIEVMVPPGAQAPAARPAP